MDPRSSLLFVLFCFGLLVTGYWSYQAFVRRQIELEAVPTLPKYMTRRPLFIYGIVGFIILSLSFYGLIVFFFEELVPLVKYIHEPFYTEIQAVIDRGDLTFPLVVAFSAAIFILLLKVEHRLNIVLISRNIIHSWAAIPRKTQDLVNRARESLEVPEHAQAAVLDDQQVRLVAAGDFSKARNTIDRKWAESSYMIHWLRSCEKTGNHGTFFNEPTLRWQQVMELYDSTTPQLEPIKSGAVGVEAESILRAYEKVQELQGQVCRLIACFLIYKNHREEQIWADARRFGIAHTPRKVPSQLGYMLFFVIGVMLAVYLGCLLTAVTYDLFDGVPLLTAIESNLGGEVVYQWIGYGIVVWCLPIFVILLGRYLLNLLNLRDPGVNYVSYAFYFLVGVLVSTLSLTATVLILRPATVEATEFEFWHLFYRFLRWGIGPGILSAYLGFRMDTMRFDHEPLKLSRRFLWVAGCTLSVAILVLGPTYNIVMPIGPWGLDKTRAIVLGTTVMIALVLATIAEFSSIKASREPRMLGISGRPWRRLSKLMRRLSGIILPGHRSTH